MDNQIVAGRKVVLEYISSLDTGDAVLYIAESAHGKIINIIIDHAQEKNIPVHKVAKSWFDEHCHVHHQGVALAINHPIHEKKNLLNLEAIAARKGVIVACDAITDPHNIGSIIRTTEALGGDAVILPRAHAPGITPTVIKASAGATAHISVLHVANLARFIEEAKSKGFWIIGSSDEGTCQMNLLNEYKPSLLVIGSEGTGMRHLTHTLCDIVVRIPLKGKVSSLNASVACGIILWELMKSS